MKKNKKQKKQITYIDPPSGRKYGFPRALPDPKPEDMKLWLIGNGYPECDVDFALNYCRMWIEEKE